MTHPASANYVLGSGEIVFARTGASVGKSYLYDPVDGQLVYAGFLINIAPDPKQLNPKFLALFAQSKEYWDWIARTSVRSGQPGVNGREYATLPVPLPDITTQDAIAEAIGDVEQFIRSLERLIAKKQAIKQGMMQQLLTGRIRLLGFTDAWGQSTVGEEFDVQLGKRLDAAVNRGALKTCINNRGVRWGRILLNEAIEAPLTHADIQTLKLTPGDVLICEGGEIGRSAVWRGELPEAYFLNTLHRLRSKGNFNPHLLVAFFERWVDTGELSAVVGKATLAHLTKENLVRVPVPMPGHDEQEGMAIILKEADDELDALRGRLAKARAIKTGMMQQLLTGRTRLPAVVAS
ncbi:hypothetical protein BHQ15_03940 [Mycolicibacillus koreensis]|nr:hypothetical protein BHQ15_03940 [Mycolicibacillus koreensis]